MSQRTTNATSFLKRLRSQGPSDDSLESLAPPSPPSFEHLELPRAEELLAQQTFEKVLAGDQLSDAEQFTLEAIIIPDKRPAIDIIHGDYSVSHPDWLNFNDQPIKTTLKKAFRSIGRIEVDGFPGLPYGGTGFVVGDGLLMTNRHVAELFARGLGEDGLKFITGRGSSIDFARDPEGDEAHQLHVRAIRMIHPFWDMALLEVDGLTDQHVPMSLALPQRNEFKNQDVAIVGYPAFDARNPSDVQQRVFHGTYSVKRLLPGKAGDRRTINSFGNRVSAVTHDGSTLGGNSGSAVVDPLTGRIIGLHFAGIYLDANFAVPAWELSKDSRIVDAGVKFEGPPSIDAELTGKWWRSVSNEGVKPAQQRASGPISPLSDASSTPSGNAAAVGAKTIFTIPIEITIRIGEASQKGVEQGEGTSRESISADAADDLDPAAPGPGEVSETADLETARTLSNLGASGQIETEAPAATEAPGAKTLGIDMGEAQSFLSACIKGPPRVTYGLGAKVPFHGAAPGRDFQAVDCSGFVRELIWRATTPHFKFPDGSVNQHDFVRAQGFQKGTIGDGKLNDGVVRIAFLRPSDSPKNIGHVVIVQNGRTLESHGGVGPDSRGWTGAGWQGKAFVYVL